MPCSTSAPPRSLKHPSHQYCFLEKERGGTLTRHRNHDAHIAIATRHSPPRCTPVTVVFNFSAAAIAVAPASPMSFAEGGVTSPHPDNPATMRMKTTAPHPPQARPRERDTHTPRSSLRVSCSTSAQLRSRRYPCHRCGSLKYPPATARALLTAPAHRPPAPARHSHPMFNLVIFTFNFNASAIDAAPASPISLAAAPRRRPPRTTHPQHPALAKAPTPDSLARSTLAIVVFNFSASAIAVAPAPPMRFPEIPRRHPPTAPRA